MTTWLASRKFNDLLSLKNAIQSFKNIASMIRESSVEEDEIYVTGGLAPTDTSEIHLYSEKLTDGSIVFNAKLFIA